MSDEMTGNNASAEQGTTASDTATEGTETQASEGVQSTQANEPGWLAGVKENVREQVAGFQTPTDLVTDWLEAKGKLENAVFLPGEDASEEERVAFYQKLGVPESIDGYELQKPETLPKGMEYDQGSETWFRDKAYELGLSKAQAGKLFSEFNNRQIESFQAAQAKREQDRKSAEEHLRSEYGEKYDANMELARRAVRQLGSEEFDKMLTDTGLTNDPAMVKFFVELGQRISPDAIMQSGAGIGITTTDPNDPDSWEMPNSFPK